MDVSSGRGDATVTRGGHLSLSARLTIHLERSRCRNSRMPRGTCSLRRVPLRVSSRMEPPGVFLVQTRHRVPTANPHAMTKSTNLRSEIHHDRGSYSTPPDPLTG